ncbi:GNAT family N-acetyltransferase [Hallella seregens]|uniref:GNAT family N-acetyltransferase n=1 Tax=Hallella seregens ATCC 51272 TaxID=1336250 RepID=A0ABV5ZG11_9BACT|nr:GNAT family N-acetyltransferase [Hallella seregens]
MPKINIQPARQEQAAEIATLIMLAMNHDCCRHFAGPNRTLDDFHRMLTHLVEREDSQYSYRNTLVAVTGRGRLAGICVGYDGRELHRLREAFYQAADRFLGRDLRGMADETQAGEFYIDSLAVHTDFRHQGIATRLLRAAIDRHGDRQPVGLLVDQGNPKAEELYRRIGFRLKGENAWGGHAMRHLQYPVKCSWCRHNALSEHYHDTEWGTPVHDERTHFMFLLMEAMSCGLSWQMMLERREVFRRCFAGFDAAAVARFDETDVERILQTEGMIRSRRKIEAMMANARAFRQVADEFGSFDRYIWSFTQGRSLIYPSHQNEWTTRNDLSDRVANDLKRRGFKFVGSTIIYSHLQAIGLINDHHKQCFRYRQLQPGCTIVEE